MNLLLPHLALSGKSGSGKTTVANYLVDYYGYQRCSSGDICRNLSNLLFNHASKSLMNTLTDSLRSIDTNCLINAALNQLNDKNTPIVFDSIRFTEDMKFLRFKDFQFIRVECFKEERFARLNQRGEVFNIHIDNDHSSEIHLDNVKFDYILNNNDSLQLFEDQIVDMMKNYD